MKSIWTLLGLILFLHKMPRILAQGKCCQIKKVGGTGAQSGTYNLVETSASIPHFCNGGCVYTKEDDQNPGTNYCFKDGDLDTSCSRSGGGGDCTSCNGIKDWIKEYFKDECGMRANAELTVMVRGDWTRCGGYSYANRVIVNATVALYKGNDNCTGEPYEVAMTEKLNPYDYYGTASFLLSIEKIEPWSVYVEKEGYRGECRRVFPRIFSSSSTYLYLDPLPKMKIKTLLLDFQINSTYDLLPEVRVMSTPLSCANGSSGSGYGGCGSGYSPPGYGSGYNCIGCNPICGYDALVSDDWLYCDCQGVIGGGLNFTEYNTTTRLNSAGQNGTIFWYNEEEYDDEDEVFNEDKFFLVFGAFDWMAFWMSESTLRNSTEAVCTSEINITLKYPDNDTDMIMRSVPCFPALVPPKPMWQTTDYTSEPQPEPEPSSSTTYGPGAGSGYTSGSGSGYTSGSGSGYPPGPTPAPEPTPGSGYTDYPSGAGSGYTSGSGSGYPSGSGSSSGLPSGFFPPDQREDYMNMFTEVDGKLVFGNGDQYWFVACMKGADLSNIITIPSFFSSKSPSDTPSFCGRVFAMFGESLEELSVEATKVCYVDALLGDGLIYGDIRNGARSKSRSFSSKPTRGNGNKPQKKKKGKKPGKKQNRNNPPKKQNRNNPPKKQNRNNPPKKQNRNNPPKKQNRGKPSIRELKDKLEKQQRENDLRNGRQRRSLKEEDIRLNSWADNDEKDDEEDEFGEDEFGGDEFGRQQRDLDAEEEDTARNYW